METMIDLLSNEGVQGLIVGLLGWLAMRVGKWLGASTDNEYAKGVLLRLNDAVFSTVMQLEQTLVAELKAANADGKLTADERKRVRDVAIDLVRDQIGPKGLEKAAKVLGLDMRIDEFISGRVESEVAKGRHAERIATATRLAAERENESMDDAKVRAAILQLVERNKGDDK